MACTVTLLNRRYVRKFDAYLHTYSCTTPRTNNAIEDLLTTLNSCLEDVKIKSNYVIGDKIRIIASNPRFNQPLSTAASTSTTFGSILDLIENVLTSDESVDIHDTTFDIQVLKLPRGCGRTTTLNLARNRHTKRSITVIRNSDNLCALRAIVVALTYHTTTIVNHSLTSRQIANIRQGRQLQGVLARKLCEIFYIDAAVGCSLKDIQRAEQLLDVQIKIVCVENFNSVIYAGPPKPTLLCLYKLKDHYDVINNMAGFYGCVYYCHRCDTCYQNKHKHRCKKSVICDMCNQPVHKEQHKIYCNNCNRYCFNEECLQNHQDVCALVHKCTGCNKVIQRNKKHLCGFSTCANCFQWVETSTHKCYMQRKLAKGGICSVPCTCNKHSDQLNTGCKANYKHPTICTVPCACNSLTDVFVRKCTYTEKYLFFDYETMLVDGVHVPILIIAHDFDGNKFVFKDNNEFCQWFISEKNRAYTAIGHNAKGYDSYFILKYCVNITIKPYTIYSGSKLMLLTIPHLALKIIDSSNFVCGPLAGFPKTFGLTELKKGYFPHYFNKLENHSYIGPLPDTSYYSPNTMKPSQRETFLKWHAERVQEAYVFDFQKELHAYCDSDVDILRRGCLELRKEFLTIANIDCFQYVTIASTCLAIYRSKYLPRNQIAVVEKTDIYSSAAVSWLSQFPGVQHALNGGEVTICGAKADGFCKESHTVYQFHGCFWHGHPDCFKNDTINHVNNETMGDLYEKTMRRSNQLRDAGYNLVEMWECEWIKECKNMPQIVEPLNPRNAFYGGRTNATKLMVYGKKLRYIDVVSLYPTVQYYDAYPVGHPLKIYNPVAYDFSWFGLIQCTNKTLTTPPRLLLPLDGCITLYYR
ncbi:uncharacterized protein [Diabrotica undecimpunctata]|uniref:uncharacterized protein n=1 Tax=Diabrotica undecimpunctata TaxID=50387 RepID=UPI003B637BED